MTMFRCHRTRSGSCLNRIRKAMRRVGRLPLSLVVSTRVTDPIQILDILLEQWPSEGQKQYFSSNVRAYLYSYLAHVEYEREKWVAARSFVLKGLFQRPSSINRRGLVKLYFRAVTKELLGLFTISLGSLS